MSINTAKVVLITGASTGFGRDTAELLASKGHRVFATMRDIAGKNRESAEAFKAKKIEVVELDVTSTKSVDAATSEIVSRAGRIDVVINNAGLATAGISFGGNQITGLGNGTAASAADINAIAIWFAAVSHIIWHQFPPFHVQLNATLFKSIF